MFIDRCAANNIGLRSQVMILTLLARSNHGNVSSVCVCDLTYEPAREHKNMASCVCLVVWNGGQYQRWGRREDESGDGSRYLTLFSLSLPTSFHEMLAAYGGCAARWQMTLLNVGRERRRV